MNTTRALTWVGIVAYVASFFLVAVARLDHPGWLCAVMALWVPLTNPGPPDMSHGLFEGQPFGMAAMLLSGLVNVIFPVLAICLLSRHRPSAFAKMKVIVLLMVSCSWLVFFYLHFVPREGHVLWVLGIVLTLFPDKVVSLFPLRRTFAIPEARE